MATKNFEKMSLDELVEWRVAQKEKVRAIQDEVRESNEAYDAKSAEAIKANQDAATGDDPVVIGTAPMGGN